ncbi:O-antigen ligase family protein [Rhodoplanes azumiensis]
MHERAWRAIPAWLPAAALLAGTTLAGPMFGGLSRSLFVLGCLACGWYGWRRGPAAHLQVALTLFAFAPFVRRILDVTLGYDQLGLMLVGPLVSLLPAVVDLIRLLESDRGFPRPVGPIVVVGACVVYAAVLTIVQGHWTEAASEGVKWGAPLLYALVLSARADRDELLTAAASAFLVILPIVGLYGIYQYVDPPRWDRYWMEFAPIMSVGYPEPFAVRVFSTMNGPASFATFTMTGLLLVCFLRSGWASLLVVSPAALSLLLSLYRTAWVALLAAVLFSLLFRATRARASAVMIGFAIAAIVVVTATPFADVIMERFSTLSDGSQDDSARERLAQYVELWKSADSTLFGVGFSGEAAIMQFGSLDAIDGMIIAVWVKMGIVVGMVCLSALVWAAANAVLATRRDASTGAVMSAAIACAAMTQIPLANIASAEVGFLFWTFVMIAPPPRLDRVPPRRLGAAVRDGALTPPTGRDRA